MHIEDIQQTRKPTVKGLRNARPTIGYTVPYIDGFGVAMWSGAIEVARERDVNLICFAGGRVRQQSEFSYQGNVLYDLMGPENVDGVVCNTTNLNWYISPEEMKEFIERYRPLPITSIGPVEGIPSILVECETGIREMMSHLIEVHKYHRIAFICGPEGHPEAEARLRAYTEALAEYGIPFDADLVTPPYPWVSDLQRSSVEAVKCLLDERKLQPKVDLQAIIGNNDASAISAMVILRERGIQVPSDVAVVGFDDRDVCRSVTPNLSTIHQPIAEQARWAAEAVLAQS